MKKFKKWFVEIEVSEVWTQDGFDMQEQLQWLMENLIPHATQDEVRAKIVDPSKVSAEFNCKLD